MNWLCVVGEGFHFAGVQKRFPFAQTLTNWCFSLLHKSPESSVLLTESTREELLRKLLRHPQILSFCSELKKERRTEGFYTRLDQAIQSLRGCFAHEAEEAVCHERLDQVFGERKLRHEIRFFCQAYEAWLKAMEVYDLPLLVKETRDLLQARGKEGLRNEPPRGRVLYFSQKTPEGLEKDFWDCVESILGFQVISGRASLLSDPSFSLPDSIENFHPHPLIDCAWFSSHTLQDLQTAMEPLFSGGTSSQKASSPAFYLSKDPSVQRAFLSFHRAQGDPELQFGVDSQREPGAFQWSVALAPLELVASQFERTRVFSWIRNREAALVQAIHERGIDRGLEAYAGGLLQPLYLELCELQKSFGGKKTVTELKQAYERLFQCPEAELFVRAILTPLEKDLYFLGDEKKKSYLIFWLEKIRARVQKEKERKKLPPPFFHWGDFSLGEFQGGFGVGLSLSDWNEDPWGRCSLEGLTGPERQVLSAEFQIASPLAIRKERLHVLKEAVSVLSSLSNSATARETFAFYDFEYGQDGRLRESLVPFLKEEGGWIFPDQPTRLGSSPKKAFSSPPLWKEVEARPLFPWLPPKKKKLAVSELDRYSRCPFQSLVIDRWRVRDLREPSSDFGWPEEKKLFFKKAIPALGPDFDSEKLRSFFESHRPLGLLKRAFVEARWLNQMEKSLRAFWKKEKEYRERAQTRPWEGSDFWVEREISFRPSDDASEEEVLTLQGRVDRVDVDGDGHFFLMHGPLSGDLPQGKELMGQAYRMSFAWSALAWEEKWGKRVLGVQFLEASSAASRSRGLFFENKNGKMEGCLTQVSPRSSSLVGILEEQKSPWTWVDETMKPLLQRWKQGDVAPHPYSQEECETCRLADLCHLKRRKKRESKLDV